jgi:hypothetical protein
MKNVNFVLFYKVIFYFVDTTNAWIRRNRNTELVKNSTTVFKKAENQLERAITPDRKQTGLKYKTIIT